MHKNAHKSSSNTGTVDYIYKYFFPSTFSECLWSYATEKARSYCSLRRKNRQVAGR